MPIDICEIREDKGGDVNRVRESEKKRFHDETVLEASLALDADWRKGQGALDNLQKAKNALTKKQKDIRKAKKGNLTDEDKAELAEMGKQGKAFKQQERDAKAALAELEQKRDAAHGKVGNLVYCGGTSCTGREISAVPVSNNEDDNRVERTWGDIPKRNGKEQHHHELLYRIGGYDPKAGTKVAGARGYFLTGPGVILNMALQQYSMDFLRSRKYTPIYPPFFMNKEIMAKTAELADFDEQLYHVAAGGKDDSDKYLIATSEQPISALHMNEWMATERLPIRYAGLSTCFRKEAGSHGRDAWGIYRVHQFEKIEQFVYCDPAKSWDMHEELITSAEDFYQSLNLPYQVIAIVSGALNDAAAKKYDLEAWFPTIGRYCELVSCSNCTDYQARAMGTRYGASKKAGGGRQPFIHMLNATLCATTRTICCILENYQDADGVHVPEVLQKYVGVKYFPFVRAALDNKSTYGKKGGGKKGKKGKKQKG